MKFFVCLLTVVVILSGARAVTAQVWDREVAPGIRFRMERQSDPALNMYGLRIDPKVVQAESALAGKDVYDLDPNNGRSVLSRMVQDQHAIGGINGDFFQWGADPGGAPLNVMVRGGELLTGPGDRAREAALGWGAQTSFVATESKWKAHFKAGSGPEVVIHRLNIRNDKDQVTLYTDAAVYAYASEAAIVARVRAGAYRLGTDSKLSGVVIEVMPLGKERVRIAPGEFLLAASGKEIDAVRSLKPGDRVQARVKVEGFDWKKIDHVIGGGPALLKDNKVLVPKETGEFATARHPRTAVGRSADGAIWYVVVDGRQTMSVGASLSELARILQRWGCVDAINLDGGGSTTLNLFDVTLNRPSGGVERAIANGVLFYGKKPAPTLSKLNIVTPEGALAVDKPVRITVTSDGVPVPSERVIYTAQGAGWIDQTGMLYPVKGGTVTVSVLVDGATTQARWEVSGPKDSGVSAPAAPAH